MDINGYQWISRFPTNTERQGWAATTSTAALCAGTVADEALLLTEAGECLNVGKQLSQHSGNNGGKQLSISSISRFEWRYHGGKNRLTPPLWYFI